MAKRTAAAKRTNMFNQSREKVVPQTRHHEEEQAATEQVEAVIEEPVLEENGPAEPVQTEDSIQVMTEPQKQPDTSSQGMDLMKPPVEEAGALQGTAQKINNRTVSPTVEIPMDITDIPLQKERGRNISIFFSPEELRFLETYPKAHGMKKSAFVSALVRKYMESVKQ